MSETRHREDPLVAYIPLAVLMALVAIFVLAPIALFVYAADNRAEPVASAQRTYEVIAHRCNTSGDIYTEQSQTACVKALKEGADFIDVDLRWTSTNTPVMLHNADLGLFGAPTVNINTVSYTQARQYVSGEGQVLSTLTQIRDLAQVTGARLSVEPKTTMTDAQWDKMNAILLPIADKVFFNSFSAATLKKAHDRGYGWLGQSVNGTVTTVPPNVQVIIQRSSTITAASLKPVTDGGAVLWCFACDTPSEWDRVSKLGVTGFATDNHTGAYDWIASRPVATPTPTNAPTATDTPVPSPTATDTPVPSRP